MIEPARIESPDEGNGGAEVARVAARYWLEDRLRMEWLNQQRGCRRIEEREERHEVCKLGHPMDGIKLWKGKEQRYCRTCNRERMRAYREIR